MPNNRLLQRSSGNDLSEVMNRSHVVAARETVQKLAAYFEKVQASFEDVRWAAEADRKLAAFLDKRTDLVTGAVASTVNEINSLQSRMASADFDYASMVDEDSPSSMFNGAEDIFDDLKNDEDVTKELGNDEVPVAPTFQDPTSSPKVATIDPNDSGKQLGVFDVDWDGQSTVRAVRTSEGIELHRVELRDIPGDENFLIVPLEEFEQMYHSRLASKYGEVKQCPACHGAQNSQGQKCKKCNGKGIIEETSKLAASSELLTEITTIHEAPAASTNWSNFSTEALTGMIKTLSNTKDFESDKESQKAVAEMSQELSRRSPVIVEDAEPKQARKSAGKAQPKKAGKLTEFTKSDWYGLAGAERFDDGSEPMLANMKTINWPYFDPAFDGKVTLVLDKNGIQILDWDGGFLYKGFPSKEESIKVAEAILAHEPVDVIDLIHRGFKPYFDNETNAKLKEMARGKITNGEIERSLGRQSKLHSLHIASPEEDQAKATEKATEKILKVIDGIDTNEIGGTQEAERLRPMVEEVKEQAEETLKATQSQLEALEVVEKNVKEQEKTIAEMAKSSNSKLSLLRGLRIASIE